MRISWLLAGAGFRTSLGAFICKNRGTFKERVILLPLQPDRCLGERGVSELMFSSPTSLHRGLTIHPIQRGRVVEWQRLFRHFIPQLSNWRDLRHYHFEPFGPQRKTIQRSTGMGPMVTATHTLEKDSAHWVRNKRKAGFAWMPILGDSRCCGFRCYCFLGSRCP